MGRRLNSTGDTIVEVLIAMAVASSVLGGAYAVVNRTMANTRQAQEHTEALQIANEQIERITYLAENDAANLYSTINKFHCADKSSGTLVNLPSSVTALPTTENRYPANCKSIGSVGYRTAFEYKPIVNTFTVYVNWANVTGNGEDQVSVVYRPFQQ